MNSDWNQISSPEDLEKADQNSYDQASIIFKHSIRCSTSALVLSRLQRSWEGQEMAPATLFYLDLINYRDLSNEISSRYVVEHQSPQVLIIKNGMCVFEASHFAVDYEVIKNKVKETGGFSTKVS